MVSGKDNNNPAIIYSDPDGIPDNLHPHLRRWSQPYLPGSLISGHIARVFSSWHNDISSIFWGRRNGNFLKTVRYVFPCVLPIREEIRHNRLHISNHPNPASDQNFHWSAIQSSKEHLPVDVFCWWSCQQRTGWILPVQPLLRHNSASLLLPWISACRSLHSVENPCSDKYWNISSYYIRMPICTRVARSGRNRSGDFLLRYRHRILVWTAVFSDVRPERSDWYCQ